MFRPAPLVKSGPREDAAEIKACETAFETWMSERQWAPEWKIHFRENVQNLIREVGGHIQTERTNFDIPTFQQQIQTKLTDYFEEKLASREGAADAAQQCTAAVFTPFMNDLVAKFAPPPPRR